MIYILGGTGQLGSAITQEAATRGFRVERAGRAVCDVREPILIANFLREATDDDTIINCVGGLWADDAESQPEKAMELYCHTHETIAREAAHHYARIAYVSSDFVFDGNRQHPYNESDEPHPLNWYGFAKAAGEWVTRRSGARWHIYRTSSLFGEYAGSRLNFVDRVAMAVREGEQFNAVADITMTPTYAGDAAQAIISLVERDADCGIYHIANRGSVTWFDLASEVENKMTEDGLIWPVASTGMDHKAERPRQSALVSARLHQYNLHLRPWQEALATYMDIKRYTKPEYEAMVK